MSSLGIEEQIDKLLTSVPAVQTTANRSFHVVDRTTTVAKSTRKQQKARAKLAKLLSFHSFNMQIFIVPVAVVVVVAYIYVGFQICYFNFKSVKLLEN